MNTTSNELPRREQQAVFFCVTLDLLQGLFYRCRNKFGMTNDITARDDDLQIPEMVLRRSRSVTPSPNLKYLLKTSTETWFRVKFVIVVVD